MTKVTQFNSKEEIQEQACLWISRIDRGCTKSEKKEIAIWINQSNAHREILMKMASLWDDLSVLNELSALFPLENATKRTRHYFRKRSLAASVIFVVFLGGSLTADIQIFPSFNQNQNVVEKFSTEVGKHEILSLSDGTSIQLNTNSIIEVVYNERQRYVNLLQGEAKFDVAKDSARPFTVMAGEKSFTALGTIFNVQKDTNLDLELLVTEGKVLISKSAELIEHVTNQAGMIKLVNLPGVQVKSGEKAVIEDNVLRPISKVTLLQVQRDLAWQQGMLIFEGEPLGKALKEISRYSNTHFEIMDDELSQLVIAGYFRADDIDGLLKSLSLNFNIHHQKMSSDLIRLSSEKI